MLVVVFYVPIKNAEAVKLAMFNAGGGNMGNYQHCAWQTEGLGQFMAMDGANPALGELNVLHKESELKIEMVCDQQKLSAVITALKTAHPYEEPAFHVLQSVEV